MGTIRWTGGNGKEQVRETKNIIDIREFKGMAGYPLLVLAANRHLSVRVLEMLLNCEGGDNVRGRNWVQRRRWMFRDPKGDYASGVLPSAEEVRALEIMRANTSMSARALSVLLAERGIRRGKDWVRQHRCD